MVLILAPVEEITQAISKQTAILSMVIPMIRVLLRSWENAGMLMDADGLCRDAHSIPCIYV